MRHFLQNFKRAGHPNATRAGQSIHACDANQILQQVTKEIKKITKSSSFQPWILKMHPSQSTYEGKAPMGRLHTSDGKPLRGSCKYSNKIMAVQEKQNPKGAENKGK